LDCIQGEQVTSAMLNCVIAACGQVGDLARAFETFEEAVPLGIQPDTDTYNAAMGGCIMYGQVASIAKVNKLATAGIRHEVSRGKGGPCVDG
jgi:pentatricopeptide repeat protein